MSTLIDVAKAAGVSPATVSRVINNSVLVSDEKKQRVHEAMEKLGYEIPVKKVIGFVKNGKLLLVISCTEHPGLYEGIHMRATGLGYTLTHFRATDCTTASDVVNLIEVLDSIGQLEGILLIDYHRTPDEELDKLLRKYPCVCIGELYPACINLVSIDDYQAGYDVTRHLLDIGKKHIAIYATKSPENRGNFELQRIRGYRCALMDRGIVPEEKMVRYTDFTSEGAAFATKKMLSTMDQLPDGIVCLSDSIAIGCICTLIQNGIRVPEDIAVVGMNNEHESEYYIPSITTIDQDFFGMGNEAVQILHLLIEGNLEDNEATGIRKIFTRYQLIERESTCGKKPQSTNEF